MKTCFKCQKEMPKTVIIEGKRRNLQNRKFCLECSPFGCHNTKPDDPSRLSFRGQEGYRVKEYSTWTEEAKEKNRLYVWKSGYDRKQKLVDMKGGCCKSCGYNKCLRALTFHHRDPSTKQFTLEMRSIRGLGWETVLKEAEKCDLYCHNCHQEIEDEIAKKNGKYFNMK
jgi:hypothetical protein